jgi:hypothetical protein
MFIQGLKIFLLDFMQRKNWRLADVIGNILVVFYECGKARNPHFWASQNSLYMTKCTQIIT